MKVDYDKNLWIDYGSNEGGTLIDLVMRIENCNNGRAMQLLKQHLSSKHSFSFQGNNTPNRRKTEPTIHITGVTRINTTSRQEPSTGYLPYTLREFGRYGANTERR